MALERTTFSALHAIKGEREADKKEFDFLREPSYTYEKEPGYSKEHDNVEWDGMEECEYILEKDNDSRDTKTLEKDELSNEKIFEKLHKTNEGKDTLGDRNSSKEKIQAPEKQKAPEMEEYVKQREDGLLAMSAGNTIHYQLEHQENMSGQNYLNQSSQVITEDYHNEREFAGTDDVVEDAFDMSENLKESIDDISLDIEKDNGVAYTYEKEDDNDRMDYPGLEDESSFSGEIEHKNPWSN